MMIAAAGNDFRSSRLTYFRTFHLRWAVVQTANTHTYVSTIHNICIAYLLCMAPHKSFCSHCAITWPHLGSSFSHLDLLRLLLQRLVQRCNHEFYVTVDHWWHCYRVCTNLLTWRSSAVSCSYKLEKTIHTHKKRKMLLWIPTWWAAWRES